MKEPQNPLKNTERFFLLFFLSALFFWVLTIIGGFRAYTPVPFWDSWDAEVDFLNNIHLSNWHILWARHNEHRIVLTRLFFLMDQYMFGGYSIFLFTVNYMLLAVITWLFWRAMRENNPEDYHIPGLFLVIWLSSWSQRENLSWGFQSQFFLAQILPLAAFMMLHKEVTRPKRNSLYFIIACTLGILSLGTMANGVLALPLMAVYAMAMRLGWRRILSLGGLATLGVIAYFHH